MILLYYEDSSCGLCRYLCKIMNFSLKQRIASLLLLITTVLAPLCATPVLAGDFLSDVAVPLLTE
jgi:preprotein translocase subunit SecF